MRKVEKSACRVNKFLHASRDKIWWYAGFFLILEPKTFEYDQDIS